jgi:peptidoglycan/xylan/chitin deacetylase (PgdA/CDA1 family)
MTAKVGDGAEVIGLCFHGIGIPGQSLEAGAADYFITRDLFLALLDLVMTNAAVSLTFDDGYASDLEIALPALLERGLSATFFPLAGRLDRPGHVGTDGIRELANAGMEVGSHGMRHRSWRGLDRVSAEEELTAAREMIAQAAGRAVAKVAIPFGSYDRHVLTALRKAEYAQVFTSDRRRARAGDWMQPRYSVRIDDTVPIVREDILAPPTLRERIRAGLAGRVKALR